MYGVYLVCDGTQRTYKCGDQAPVRQVHVIKVYVASGPAHSDYPPVGNVSSLCAPCGLARTSARLGAVA
jgi:hypothetical protein